MAKLISLLTAMLVSMTGCSSSTTQTGQSSPPPISSSISAIETVSLNEKIPEGKDNMKNDITLTLKATQGNVFYKDQAVKSFIDEKNDGSVFMYQSLDGGDITVRTVYDENGKITGIKVGD